MVVSLALVLVGGGCLYGWWFCCRVLRVVVVVKVFLLVNLFGEHDAHLDVVPPSYLGLPISPSPLCHSYCSYKFPSRSCWQGGRDDKVRSVFIVFVWICLCHIQKSMCARSVFHLFECAAPQDQHVVVVCYRVPAEVSSAVQVENSAPVHPMAPQYLGDR